MTFYVCFGKTDLSVNINWTVGIRISLFYVSICLLPTNIEQALISSLYQTDLATYQSMLLLELIKEKLPEEYEKLVPPVPTEEELN